MEPRLAPDGDLRPFTDYVTKHEGRVARIAGLLHLAEHSVEEPISSATMTAALRIGEYLLAHTLFGVTVADETTRRALAWLKAREQACVSKREIHYGLLRHAKAADVDHLIDRLVALDAIRPLERIPSSRTGRPAGPLYELNPHLKGEGASPREDWWRAVEADGEPELAGEGPTVEDLAVLSPNRSASS